MSQAHPKTVSAQQKGATSSEPDVCLLLEGVHKRYGSLHVLDSVDLEVHQHEIVAVLIHVEQVFLAQKQRPGVNKLADLWKARPHYFYGVFIAPDSKLQSKRDVYVRFAAAMMQSTRAVYQDKAGYLETARKWIKPIYQEHPDLMSNTYDTFVQERIWSVNNGLPKAWIDWTNQLTPT